MSLTYKEVLYKLLDTLKNAVERVEAPEYESRPSASDHDQCKFFQNFSGIVEILKQESNKLALSFNKEPFPTPEETLLMAVKAEENIGLLAELVATGPKECGR